MPPLSVFKELSTIKTENMKELTYMKKEGISCSSQTFQAELLVSPLGLQVLMSPLRTFQAVPVFVFLSEVGTDLDKGDSGLFSPPGSLE